MIHRKLGNTKWCKKPNLGFNEVFIVKVKDENNPDVGEFLQILKRIFRVVELLAHHRDVDEASRARRNRRLARAPVLGGMARLDEPDRPKQELVDIVRRQRITPRSSSWFWRLRQSVGDSKLCSFELRKLFDD